MVIYYTLKLLSVENYLRCNKLINTEQINWEYQQSHIQWSFQKQRAINVSKNPHAFGIVENRKIKTLSIIDCSLPYCLLWWMRRRCKVVKILLCAGYKRRQWNLILAKIFMVHFRCHKGGKTRMLKCWTDLTRNSFYIWWQRW